MIWRQPSTCENVGSFRISLKQSSDIILQTGFFFSFDVVFCWWFETFHFCNNRFNQFQTSHFTFLDLAYSLSICTSYEAFQHSFHNFGWVATDLTTGLVFKDHIGLTAFNTMYVYEELILIQPSSLRDQTRLYLGYLILNVL